MLLFFDMCGGPLQPNPQVEATDLVSGLTRGWVKYFSEAQRQKIREHFPFQNTQESDK